MSASPSYETEEATIFHEGIELYNEGDWFDAHEAWEDIWHMASGEKKSFYQGLIQCAVTIEHCRRGNPRGVRSVWASCVPKFDGLPDVYMGVNIRQLLGEVGDIVRPILDLPAEYFEPGRGRGQDIGFDPDAVKPIPLEYDPFEDERSH